MSVIFRGANRWILLHQTRLFPPCFQPLINLQWFNIILYERNTWSAVLFIGSDTFSFIFYFFFVSNFPVFASTTGSVNRPGPVPAFLRSPPVIPAPLDMKPFLQFPLESPHPASIGLFHNFNTVSTTPALLQYLQTSMRTHTCVRIVSGICYRLVLPNRRQSWYSAAVLERCLLGEDKWWSAEDLYCIIQNDKVTAVYFLFSRASFSIIEKTPGATVLLQ